MLLLRRTLMIMLVFVTITSQNSYSQLSGIWFEDQYAEKELKQIDSLRKLIRQHLSFFVSIRNPNSIIEIIGPGVPSTQSEKRNYADFLEFLSQTLIDSIKANQLFFKFSSFEYKILYEKIQKLNEKGIVGRNKLLDSELMKQIMQLNPSVDKIQLLLQYSNQNIGFDWKLYNNIRNLLPVLTEAAGQIQSSSEKCASYLLIGDFLHQYHESTLAIQLYYLAIEEMYSQSEKKDSTYYSTMGTIYERIATLFLGYLNFAAVEKGLNYYDLAVEFHKNSGNLKKAGDTEIEAFARESYLNCHDFLLTPQNYIRALETCNTNLERLHRVFEQNEYLKSNEKIVSTSGNYFLSRVMYSIATYLEDFEFKQTASMYYFESAMYAFFNKDLYFFNFGIENMAYILNLLGQSDQSIQLSKTARKINTENKNVISHYYSNSNLIMNFLRAANYDSVFRLADQFLFNPAISTAVDPYTSGEIRKQMYWYKSTAFQKVGRYDSALIYNNYYNEMRLNEADIIIGLVNVENLSIQKWFSKVKEKQLSTSKALANAEKIKNKTLDENLRLEAALRKQVEYREAKVKEDLKITKDMLADVNDSLSNARILFEQNVRLYRDSIDTLDKEVVSTKKLFRNTLSSGLITLCIMLFISGVLFFVLRKQVKSIRTLEQEAADLLSLKDANEKAYFLDLQYKNEHIKNELSVKHEIAGVFDNLVASFSLIERNIKTGSASEFGRKLEKSRLFAKTYYKSLDSDTYRTIEDEIFLSHQYIEFVKMRKNTEEVHFWDKRTIKKKNVPIPPHLINNFVKNSEEKARIPERPLNIEVSDSVIDGNYVLQIKDDGKGINPDFSLNNLPSESTGFRNVLSQIEYYNARPDQEYQIKFDNSSVLNREIVEGLKGTIIKLIFTSKP